MKKNDHANYFKTYFDLYSYNNICVTLALEPTPKCHAVARLTNECLIASVLLCAATQEVEATEAQIEGKARHTLSETLLRLQHSLRGGGGGGGGLGNEKRETCCGVRFEGASAGE